MTILSQLKRELNTLSKAERRIAEVILQDPEAVVHTTTAELARSAGVSDPMVSRLCRSLGCKSFPVFKVQLAKSLVNHASFFTEAVAPGDDTRSYIDKRIQANRSAIDYIQQNLQPKPIEAAVSALQNAQRIEIFGMGGCAAIAQDAQHKLFRLGTPTTAYTDHLMQRMVAAAANKETVVLVFSFTGRTQSLFDAASIAAKNSATLIAITSPDSPLAKIADIVIDSGSELEDTTIYVPMTTRIAILTIIDILVTGLALSLGTEIDDHLQRVKHSLDDTKF